MCCAFERLFSILFDSVRPHAEVVVDSEASNNAQVHLWKFVLAQITEFYRLETHVSHLPSVTCKCNNVEHRGCSYITEIGQVSP